MRAPDKRAPHEHDAASGCAKAVETAVLREKFFWEGILVLTGR
jgi:hypothetical protein